MKTFAEINAEMEEIQKQIDLASGELCDSREEFLKKTAEYEFKMSKSYLTQKASYTE